ncbi:MAG TPA: hypothetical protein VIO64_11630 [Pseudobacteroides sp.]|uniref:hypothetical protein n=1 Tax=Pseudobacteroides sp. TaxID=1968840 RepID=UPI002F924797
MLNSMMLKIIMVLFLCFLSIFIFTTCDSSYSRYEEQYTISDNSKDIKLAIENEINTSNKNVGKPTNITIIIRNEAIIDDLKLVLSTMSDGNLALYQFKINEKNMLRSVSGGYSSGSIGMPVIETKKGKYLLVYGGKFEKKLSYIIVKLMEKEYVYNIADKEYFIDYYMVDKDVQKTSGESYRLLDEKNIEVTGF